MVRDTDNRMVLFILQCLGICEVKVSDIRVMVVYSVNIWGYVRLRLVTSG
jgi:hypothetical protein